MGLNSLRCELLEEPGEGQVQGMAVTAESILAGGYDGAQQPRLTHHLATLL